jgi:predicted enzyme related to lactoylglutathione lyase
VTSDRKEPDVANEVSWFEVTGKDGDKLQQFYGGLFGWQIDADNPMRYGMVQAADGGIGGGIGPSPDGGGHVTFYVAVDDPQAYLDRAEQLGGKTVVPVTEVPDMVTFARFADPEGNVVGVVKNTR